jgi:hypothetical protein
MPYPPAPGRGQTVGNTEFEPQLNPIPGGTGNGHTIMGTASGLVEAEPLPLPELPPVQPEALGSWLEFTPYTLESNAPGTTDVAILQNYVPPPGWEVESVELATTTPAGDPITRILPPGTTGSMVANALRLVDDGTPVAVATDARELRFRPIIRGVVPAGGGGGGTVDDEADWLLRSAGRVMAFNFSEYGTDAELAAAGAIAAQPPGGSLDAEYKLYRGDPGGPPVLSGGKCLEIRTFDRAGQNGGNWSFRPPTRMNNFYFQVEIALDRAALFWRRTNTDDGQKLMTINVTDTTGGGQIALYVPKLLGFPGFFTDGSGGVERYLAGSGGRDNDWFYQNAIYTAQPFTTNVEANRVFGPSRHIRVAREPLPYIGTNAAANYADARGFPVPNPDALLSGAVPFTPLVWMVFEFYINMVPSAGGDVAICWAAPRGQPPKRIWNLGVAVSGPGSFTKTSLGGSLPGVNLISFMNYPTNQPSEVGYRPVMRQFYDEVVIDYSAIPFPFQQGVPLP